MRERLALNPNTHASSSGGVSGWRDETRADLKNAEGRIVALIAEISGEPTEEQVRSIWRAYLDVEKSVAFIRVEIDEENPGRFVKAKQYSVPDERQALQFALRNLRKGTESFVLGDYRSSLRELREARNYLRLILKAKRRIKTKETKAYRTR
jgi:hypothetical protein